MSERNDISKLYVAVATLMQLVLSSNTLHFIVGSTFVTFTIFPDSSIYKFINGITSCIDWDNVIYLASVALNAISVCNLLAQ